MGFSGFSRTVSLFHMQACRSLDLSTMHSHRQRKTWSVIGLKPRDSEAYVAACEVEWPAVPRGCTAKSIAFISLLMQDSGISVSHKHQSCAGSDVNLA